MESEKPQHQHRIKIKIGDAEFDAAGDSGVIQAQFDAFLAALSAASAKTPSVAAGSVNPIPPAPSPTPPSPSNPNDFARVFRQGDPLSLLALPKGKNVEAEALLMLLYGYTKLGTEPSVTGTTLMKAAKQSGVSAGRIDRLMDGKNKEYVLAAGAKKGRRYSLNNRGIAQAELLMKNLFE